MPTFDTRPLLSDDPQVKYPAGKAAIAFAKANPKALYPHFDLFAGFLGSDKNVMKWVALQVIAHLVNVDTEKKVVALVPLIKKLFHSDSLITSSNAVLALSAIARLHEDLRGEILAELITVDKNNYVSKGKPSPECRNVVIQHVLEEMARFDRKDLAGKDVASFIRRQTKNSRPGVRRIAKRLYETNIESECGERVPIV